MLRRVSPCSIDGGKMRVGHEVGLGLPCEQLRCEDPCMNRRDLAVSLSMRLIGPLVGRRGAGRG